MPKPKKTGLFRPWMIIFLLAVVGAGVWFGLQSGKTSTATTTSTERQYTVTRGTLRQTVSASGTIAPSDTEDLNFASSGTVTAVNVKAGDKVTKGEVLATIDSAALSNAVAQAQATVDTDAARLSTDTTAGASAAQLQSDQATLDAANSSLATAKTNLAGATMTSPIDGVVASQNLTVGEQLSSSGTGANGLSGSGTGSGRTAGTGSTSSGNGNNSSSNSSSSSSSSEVQVVSDGTFLVTVNVDSTQIANVKVGQVATVTPVASTNTTGGGGGRFAGGFGGFGGGGFGGGGFGGGGGGSTTGGTAQTGGTTSGNATSGSTDTTANQATGVVTSVSSIATTSSGVATFPVSITLTGSPAGFYSGGSAQVGIVYNQIDNALQVPVAAITTASDGTTTVTVVANNQRSTRTVTTGITASGEVQILTGLTENEQIIVKIPTRTTTNGTTSGRTTGGTGGTGGTGTGGGFTRRNATAGGGD